jgi:hypothetical protein
LIHFRTFAGYQYSLESTTNLTPPNWLPAPAAGLGGTGRDESITDTNALLGADQRFYRLKESR